MNEWLLRAPVGLVLIAVYIAQLVWMLRHLADDPDDLGLIAFLLMIVNLTLVLLGVGWLVVVAGTYVVTGGLP